MAQCLIKEAQGQLYLFSLPTPNVMEIRLEELDRQTARKDIAIGRFMR
jgi:hypothetical protein